MKKIIQSPAPSAKDDKGQYVKTPVLKEEVRPTSNLTVDELMAQGLFNIERIMKAISMEASTGVPSREAVMNLKDCMVMLHELKKKEQEILDGLSDEELQKALDANS